MSTSRLEALPSELLVLIAEYLFRRDLWACCRASKTLRTTATPLLYESVRVSSSRSMTLGQGLLDRKNAGLPYVHNFQFDASREGESLRRTLLLLPEDRLRNIEVKNLELDDVIFSSLFARQRKLESIALGPLPREALAYVTSGFFDDRAWTNLKILELPSRIRSTSDLDVWSAIINAASKLQHLIIRTFQISIAPPNGTPLQDVNASKRGVLFSKLFPTLTATQLVKLVLRSLTLASTCLILAQENIMRAVDFSKLVELRLERCGEVDYLLNSLAKSFKADGCALRGFWLTTSHLYADEGLDNFLLSFGGLRKLYISLTSDDVFWGFDTSCLDTHKQSLEEFAIQTPFSCTCDPEDRIPREAASLLRVCTKLPRLKQVGLTVPLTMFGAAEPQYADGIRSLLCHQTLQTLRIFNFPVLMLDLSDADDRLEEYFEELESFLQEHIVNPILEANADHRFPALIVGNRGDCCYEEDHLAVDDAVYFRIGKYRGPDVFRANETVISRMTLKEAEGLVPEFDVAKID